MSRRNRSRRDASFTIAERGHVPFAMIAVLLLVSSIGVVAVLEQRSEPTINRDAQEVMDRSETAAQSELRTAALEATHQAGAAPINTTAGSSVSAIASESGQEAFERYVKLLVYIEAADRLPAAGQSMGTDTRSSVSLEPVTSGGSGDGITPSEAIERVELDIGRYESGLENGTVDVTIEDVEFEAQVDGETVPTETRSISTTVGTPVFELNEKMNEYESELNRGFFESDGMPDPTSLDGLGQEMAARLYPIAYMKAGWNRLGEKTTAPQNQTFEEVIDTDHAEVLANNAIFSVQEEVFGTRDPHASRTMRPQYLCMSLDLATNIGDVDLEVDMNDIVPSDNITFAEDLEDQGVNSSEMDGDENVTVPVNGTVDFQEEFCDDSGSLNKWIFGDKATGDLPEVPPVSELIQDGVDSMEVGNQEIEVPVNTLANATYYEYAIEDYTLKDLKDPATYIEDQADNLRSTIQGEGGDVDDFEIDDITDDDYERTLEDIRDELYKLGVRIESDAWSGSVPSPSSPGSGYSRYYALDTERIEDVTINDVRHNPHPDGDDYTNREIHTITADASVDVYVRHGWVKVEDNRTITETTNTTGSVGVGFNATITSNYRYREGGEHFESAGQFRVAENPIETDYGTHENVTFREGFETALEELTSVGDYSRAESDLESDLRSALSSSDPDSLESAAESALTDGSSATLTVDQVIESSEESELEPVMHNELETVHSEFQSAWENDPFKVELSELTEDETPPQKVMEYIKDEIQPDLVDESGYETPEDNLRQQVRKAYFDRIYYWLELFDDEYSTQLDGVNDKLNDVTGDQIDGLNEVLGFVQDFANADFDPDPVDLEGSPVLDDAQYEVSGAPTYLAATSINRSIDPAVRPETSTVADANVPSDFHHDPLAIKTHNRVPWPGLPVVLPLPSNWYATVNTWNVEVEGEYARLEVSSTVGDPADTDRLTYVAEASPVEVELNDGSTVQVGKNEAVDFDTSTEVIVIMPGAVVQTGGPVPAVADGRSTGSGATYCSQTWDEVGPDAAVDYDNCDNLG
ncbi:DUF7286 family protein [Halopiger goleimassiliensis]|uniref:DUF7286 family protein n=1 Tax=Halopiger goleimassiliensis TaxID=1293048 RepID=UPI000677B829|nr:hypothetical protein [Halopiger goleimassiliensis]